MATLEVEAVRLLKEKATEYWRSVASENSHATHGTVGAINALITLLETQESFAEETLKTLRWLSEEPVLRGKIGDKIAKLASKPVFTPPPPCEAINYS